MGEMSERLEIQEVNVDKIISAMSKSTFREQVEDCQNPILDIKKVLSEAMSSNFANVAGNASKIAALEYQLAGIKNDGHDQHSRTMVVGDIGQDIEFEAAEAWVREQIQKHSKTNVLAVFAKDDYRGMVFCKFESQHSRDVCVCRLRRASPQRHNHRTLFSEDQPADIRACYSILFDARRQMLNWGESKDKIWIDKDDLTLYYGRDLILVCEVQGSEVKVHMDEQSTAYFDGALDDIIHAVNSSLARSIESKTAKKGKSKGSSSSSLKGKGITKGKVLNSNFGNRLASDGKLPPWRKN